VFSMCTGIASQLYIVKGYMTYFSETYERALSNDIGFRQKTFSRCRSRKTVKKREKHVFDAF